MTLPDSTLRLIEVAFDEALAVARELMNSPDPAIALRAARMVMSAERKLQGRARAGRPREYVVYVHPAPPETRTTRRPPPALPGGPS
jgi:hypothetical protein